jgi:hypothetical protein
MSKRSRELAEQLADAHLQKTGIAKAAGAGFQRADLVDMYLPLADGVVVIEKASRQVVKIMQRQEEISAQLSEQVRVLKALDDATHAPMIPGFAAFEPGRFRLQAVPDTPPVTLADPN